MDFVPTPLSSRPGIQVPLFDIIPYDFRGLSEFPERNGISKEQLVTDGRSPLQVATLLQSWLYFGLLSEVLGKAIDARPFASNHEESIYPLQIQTRALKDVFAKEPYPSQLDNGEIDRRQTLVEQAALWLREVEDSPIHKPQNAPLMETTLSIRMLLYALGPYAGSPIIELMPHPLISLRLEEHGWCPSHIARIEVIKNDIFGYYLSCLLRPNPTGLSHHSCPRTNCEASSTTLSDSYYIRHTHSDKIPCQSIQVNETKIRQIINKDGIPLVSIQFSLTGEISLQVRAATPQDKYIAISHVWSDGLGNPKSNALPACQLRRLATYFANLPQPSSRVYDDNSRTAYSLGPISFEPGKLQLTYSPSNPSMLFWMDTLCIPVSRDENDSETKRLKFKAINHMAEIYSRARQVLVLDSSLQSLRLGVMQRCEILAHIAFCNWMGRCWTFQESALNQFVYLQFADGALNILDRMPDPSEYHSDPLKMGSLDITRLRYQGLTATLHSLTWPYRHILTNKKPLKSTSRHSPDFEAVIYETLHKICTSSFHASGHYSAENYFSSRKVTWEDAVWVQRVVTVWNSLAGRTTTMAEDLPAIFANLLDLDTAAILALPIDQRLGEILYTKHVLPLSILYNRGPKLKAGEVHCDRWIPTLMSRFKLDEVPMVRVDPISQKLILSSEEMGEDDKPTVLFPDRQLGPAEWGRKHVRIKASDGTVWRIECDRAERDQLVQHKRESVLFVIEGPLVKRVHVLPRRACCIRIRKSTGNSEFEGIYDCACIATRVVHERIHSNEDGRVETQFEAEYLKDWKITLLSDRKTNSRAKFQGAEQKSSSAGWLNHLLYI
jgi:hypothetical protein